MMNPALLAHAIKTLRGNEVPADSRIKQEYAQNLIADMAERILAPQELNGVPVEGLAAALKILAEEYSYVDGDSVQVAHQGTYGSATLRGAWTAVRKAAMLPTS